MMFKSTNTQSGLSSAGPFSDHPLNKLLASSDELIASSDNAISKSEHASSNTR